MATSLEIQSLIEWVHSSAMSSFYREKWGEETEFTKLPAVTRADFLSTPLSLRRYKEEKALVKVVRSRHGLFASEWSFADSAKEDFGLIGTRPLVYLSDPDEAIEKSMWAYERGILPLIGEALPEIVHSGAHFYRIDSLITDEDSIHKLLPYLDERTELLKSITIIGESFILENLLRYKRYTQEMQLVLSLPETGAFAHARLSDDVSFTLLPGCYIERGDKVLLTKMTKLVTPIIKYELPASVSLPALNG